MNHLFRYLYIIFTATFVISCETSKNDLSEDFSHTEYGTLSIRFVDGDYEDTKSLSQSVEFQKISDACLLVYDTTGRYISGFYSENGRFQDTGYFAAGQKYKLYAIANVGNVLDDIVPSPDIASQHDILSYRYLLESYNGLVNNGCLPMAGSTTILFSKDSEPYPITLYNLTSKVTVRLTKNLENGFSASILSLRLRNAAKYIYPFKSKSGVIADTDNFDNSDYADDSEVAIADNGNSVTFIAFENMQGTPSGGIASSKDRIGDCRCTYLEIAAHITNGIKETFPIYRWWIGDDNDIVRNFDMKRGTEYIVNITLKNEGFSDDDQRVINKNWRYLITGISISPPHNNIYVNQTATFTANVLPDNLDTSLKNVTWSVTDSSKLEITEQTGTSCTVKGTDTGSVHLIATSVTDPTYSASVAIAVEEDIITWSEITYTPQYSYDIPASGGERSVTFNFKQDMYRNGTYSSTETWTETGSPVSAESRGTIAGNRKLAGISSCSTSRNGKTATASANVYQAANNCDYEYLGEVTGYELTLDVSPMILSFDGGTATISGTCKWGTLNCYENTYSSGCVSHEVTPTRYTRYSTPKLKISGTGFRLSGTTLIAEPNDGTSPRECIITAQSSANWNPWDEPTIGSPISVTVIQEGCPEITYGDIVCTGSADDIPASGGTVKGIFLCSQERFADNTPITPETWTEEGSPIEATSLGATEKERTQVGISSVSGIRNGKPFSSETVIYQQANAKVSSQATFHKNFNIEVSLQPSQISSSGGTAELRVTATADKFSYTRHIYTSGSIEDTEAIPQGRENVPYNLSIISGNDFASLSENTVVVVSNDSEDSRTFTVKATANGYSDYNTATGTQEGIPSGHTYYYEISASKTNPAYNETVIINRKTWRDNVLTQNTSEEVGPYPGESRTYRHVYYTVTIVWDSEPELSTDPVITFGEIASTLISNPDIPNTGGSSRATWNISQTEYHDGTAYATHTETIEGSIVSASNITGGQSKQRTFIGNSTATANMNGKTKNLSAEIYQQEWDSPQMPVYTATRFGTWNLLSGKRPSFDKGYWLVEVEYVWDTGYPELDAYFAKFYGTGSKLHQSWDNNVPDECYAVYADILGTETIIGTWNRGLWFPDTPIDYTLPRPDGGGKVQLENGEYNW